MTTRVSICAFTMQAFALYRLFSMMRENTGGTSHLHIGVKNHNPVAGQIQSVTELNWNVTRHKIYLHLVELKSKGERIFEAVCSQWLRTTLPFCFFRGFSNRMIGADLMRALEQDRLRFIWLCFESEVRPGSCTVDFDRGKKIHHHPSGCWHSERPGSNLCRSTDPSTHPTSPPSPLKSGQQR